MLGAVIIIIINFFFFRRVVVQGYEFSCEDGLAGKRGGGGDLIRG